jgi:glycosyltransferase involved in cell wall biosynthesis
MLVLPLRNYKDFYRPVAAMMSKRVLFVGHDASRTGAPLLLLQFLRWLTINSRLRFEILLSKGGDLVPEYSLIARTHVLNGSVPRSHIFNLIRRVRTKLRLGPSRERLLRRRYSVQAFPVIYSNTVANGELVGLFGRHGHRVICHAHEMKFGIACWGGEAAKESSTYVQSFIAASQAVKRDLKTTWDLSDDKIEVIQSFSQPCSLNTTTQQQCRSRIRAMLQITDATVVVGMCGTADWRKGADLFPILAKIVKARAGERPYRFVWIGSRATIPEHLQLACDVERLGLDNDVVILGEVRDAQEYMAAFDIFTLTSREDPCPLVMLEAAALGLPIVCFAQSGGAPDFVGEDAGKVVPYMDVAAMADAVLELGADPTARYSLGKKGSHRVASEFTVHSQAPKLLAVIERNLA